MKFKLINLFPESLLHALGATLFHSLWLGVILALTAGLIVATTRKFGAAIRYNLLTLCLALFTLATFGIFFYELNNVDHEIVSVRNQLTQQNVTISTTNATVDANLKDQLKVGVSAAFGIWNQYANMLVMIWFLFICTKGIRLLVGLQDLRRLRYEGTFSAGEKWEEKVKKLASRFNLSPEVSIVQSRFANVPMVIGHLKPIILIPLGLLNGLSDVEIEAILSHELAHIKRRDFLVNLVQGLVEIVFFFNPAVLWVSKLIKIEREHCCDDLAVTSVNDRKNYVKALIFCQEFKQSAPAYALSITGKNGSLLSRVSRMMFNKNSTLTNMEKTILSVVLVSVVACTISFKNVSKASSIDYANTSMALQHADTTKKVSLGQSKNAEAEQEDKRAAAHEAKAKEKEAERINVETKRVKEEQKRQTVEARRIAEEHKRYAEEAKRYQIEASRYEAEANRYREEAKKYKSEGLVPPVPPTPPTPPTPIAVSVPITPTIPITAVTPITPAIPLKPQIPPTHVQTGVQRTVTSKTVTDGDGHDYTDEINRELLKDGIIANTKKLSYKLNNNEFIVNGKKQSQSIAERYKKNFLKNEGHALLYNYEIENYKSGF